MQQRELDQSLWRGGFYGPHICQSERTVRMIYVEYLLLDKWRFLHVKWNIQQLSLPFFFNSNYHCYALKMLCLCGAHREFIITVNTPWVDQLSTHRPFLLPTLTESGQTVLKHIKNTSATARQTFYLSVCINMQRAYEYLKRPLCSTGGGCMKVRSGLACVPPVLEAINCMAWAQGLIQPNSGPEQLIKHKLLVSQPPVAAQCQPTACQL